uniref:Uncharacterized protein n=1 Tax=Glossina pallidipes TaxID=7398 RepID=A0A1A9ZMC9_GLOPL
MNYPNLNYNNCNRKICEADKDNFEATEKEKLLQCCSLSHKFHIIYFVARIFCNRPVTLLQSIKSLTRIALLESAKRKKATKKITFKWSLMVYNLTYIHNASGRFSLNVIALAEVSNSCNAIAYISGGASQAASHRCKGESQYDLLLTFQVAQYILKCNDMLEVARFPFQILYKLISCNLCSSTFSQ